MSNEELSIIREINSLSVYDNIDEPIEFNEDYILPRIHHVGLPQNVVDNDKKLASIA